MIQKTKTLIRKREAFFWLLVFVVAASTGIGFTINSWGESFSANAQTIAQQPLAPVLDVESVDAGQLPVLSSPQPTLLPHFLNPIPSRMHSGKIQAHILMYHYIRLVDAIKDPLGYRLSVTAPALGEQLALLNRLGYTPLSMQQLAAGLGGPKSVVLTFDDGYEDFYTAALPVLKQYGWTATIYVISHKIGGAYLTWDQIREMQAQGMEIGAHTVDHNELDTLPLDKAKYQILTSKKEIEAQTGKVVTAFCYPVGHFNADIEKLVQTAGFKTATTTQPGGDYYGMDQFALPRVRISPSVNLVGLQKLLTW